MLAGLKLLYRDLGVSNLVTALEGTKPTVVGWGYTSGFDPWSLEPQVLRNGAWSSSSVTGRHEGVRSGFQDSAEA